MINKGPWKSAERTVAKFLGGRRTPLSGGNSGHTTGDVIHDELYVEVKYRQRFAVLSLMEEVRLEAKRERKIPIVVLQQARSKRRYYVIEERDIERILELLA